MLAAAIILVAAAGTAAAVWPRRRPLTIGLSAVALAVAVAALIEAIA